MDVAGPMIRKSLGTPSIPFHAVRSESGWGIVSPKRHEKVAAHVDPKQYEDRGYPHSVVETLPVVPIVCVRATHFVMQVIWTHPSIPPGFSITLIVKPDLSYQQFVSRYFVYEPVFGIYSSGPIATQRVPKRLGFSNASMRVSNDFLEEQIDARKCLGICVLPIQVILPCPRGKNQFHASRSG